MSEPVPEDARPHVVLFRPYDVHVDTRAKKIALTLSRLGYRVTVLANSAGDVAVQARLSDGVAVELIPVAFRVRDAVARRRNARRTWVPPLAPPPDQVAARRMRTEVLLRDLAAREEGAAGRSSSSLRTVVDAGYRLRRSGVRARQKSIAVRVRAQRLAAAQWRQGWRAYDHLVRKVRLGSSWHGWLPEVYDWSATFGPRLVALRPDILHVHDPKVLGVACASAVQLRHGGHPVRIVYDARENFVGLPRREWGSPRYHQAIVNLEASHIRSADKVLTVSEPIADTLQQRYSLPVRPTVVLNLPVDHGTAATVRDVRQVVGVGPEVPLLVYSGGLSHARGADVLVEAMGRLDGIHLAMVTVPHPHPMMPALLELAARHKAADRIHVLPPVPQGELIGFLATADVGVHPMPAGSPNHEMALPNKLFEYLHAGLPLVVSDAREICRFVSEHRVGECFRSGDPESLADAVSKVLVDPTAYRLGSERSDLVRRFSWQGQEALLAEVYGSLVQPPGGLRRPGWAFPGLTVVGSRESVT